MKRAIPFHYWMLSVLTAIATAWPIASFAQADEVDADALQLLRRSTEYLAGTNQFRVDADATIEAVLSTGQKLQLGQRVAVTVQRPNRLRVERLGELINRRSITTGRR